MKCISDETYIPNITLRIQSVSSQDYGLCNKTFQQIHTYIRRWYNISTIRIMTWQE